MERPDYSVEVPSVLHGKGLPVPLRPYVQEYFEAIITASPGATAHILVSATTDPVLNASLSSPLTIRIGDGFVLPPVTIAGPQPLAYSGDAVGVAHSFCVRFKPCGPLVLLGVESYSLEEGARPLHEMVRPALAGAARSWSEALLRAPTFEDRVALTNRFLLAHRSVPDYRAGLVQAAVDAIEEAGGNLRIASLAGRLGVSGRTLRRHFGVLGMPPKHFAAVVRFRQAHAYLRATPGATWADAVGRFGYADQAHFVREYRRFSGSPPTRWDPGLRAVDRRMGIEDAPGGQG